MARIKHDFFEVNMKSLFNLMGWTYKDEQMKALYEVILKEGFQEVDLEEACKSMRDEHRFLVSQFIKYTREHKIDRKERERAARTQRERAEVDQFLFKKQEECSPGERCQHCEKDICKTEGRLALRGIIGIIDERITEEQMRTEMDKVFPGREWLRGFKRSSHGKDGRERNTGELDSKQSDGAF